MPVVVQMPVHKLKAIELERELNAALWGNRFGHIATFQMKPGVAYLIGDIAQTDDAETGDAGATLIYAQSFIMPKGLCMQVTFVLEPHQDISVAVKMLPGDNPVPGAYRFANAPGQA